MKLTPVLLIAIPLLTAFLMPILSIINKKLPKYITPLPLLFVFLAAIWFLPKVLVSPISEILVLKPPFGINLILSPLSLFLTLIVSFIGFLISIYNLKYNKDAKIENEGKFSILFILIITGAVGIILTGDIFNLFVFLEIMAISAFSLVALKKDKLGIEAAIKYLLIGSISTVFILLGIGLIYANLGTLNLIDIANNFHSIDSKIKLFILISFIIGFGIEAEIFPLNFWVPDVYSTSYSNIVAVLSGITVKASLYALFRFIYSVYSFDEYSKYILMILAALTILIAELVAFRQNDIKRMLAYSSLGQIGLIILAFSIGSKDAIQGGLLHILNHSIIKALLFLIAGYFVIRVGTSKISQLKGIAKRMPLASFLFVLGALAVVGFPPLNGFFSKFLILKAFASKEHFFLITLVLSVSVVEAIYYFKVIQTLYSKNETNETITNVKELPVVPLISIMILGIMIIFLGIMPDMVMNIINSASTELYEINNYLSIIANI